MLTRLLGWDTQESMPRRGPPNFGWGEGCGCGLSRWWIAAAVVASIGVVWLVTVALMARPAEAAPTICGDRAEMTKTLMERYGEYPRVMGVSGDGSLLEVYASADTGTWTVLMSRPNGTACMLAAGQSLEVLPVYRPGQQA